MLSGIASYLFGTTSETADREKDEILLTTLPADNEWLLVDRADTVPLPIEHCPFVDHLEDSIVGSLSSDNGQVASVVGERHQPSSAYVATRSAPTHIHHIIAPERNAVTPWRLKPQSRVITRKSLDRGNRAYEHMSHSKQPRRYNYMFSYSRKHKQSL